MAAGAARIRVLLVAADPQVLQTVGATIDQPGFGYGLRSVSSREEFFARLRSRLPDVFLLADAGLPGFPLKDILKAVRKIGPGLPMVVLGQECDRHSRGRAALGATPYLQIREVERLASLIERALREQQARNSQTHLRGVNDRAARLIARNQKLATIGQLTGSIAHEINNPLEAVTNLLFLMEHGELSPALREYLTLAQRELDRAVRISKQTLNFSRESPAPVRVGLGGLLDEVLVLYARRIARKQLEVVRQFINDDPVVVFPGEMRQVFSNLISNAIEASPEHGRLYLRLRKSRHWGDVKVTGMRVTVADQGAGIPAKIRHRVGEPFFTTKGETGTGLGLWVTHSIVRIYGGNLLLHSSTGERHGTVFSLFLPTNLRPQAVTSAGERTMTGAFAAGSQGEAQAQEEVTGGPFVPGSRPLAS
jgi:two-component system NtrC family sensor kinase